LALSPESWRGFSGEGGLLRDLASDDGGSITKARAMLKWQIALDPKKFDKKALAALASRGLVGFDLAAGAYFHRELPFALESLEGMHPRLEDARKLVAAGAVTDVKERAGVIRAEVTAKGGGAYRVQVGAEELGSCTCPWYAKHGTERGPCKHVLAVQLVSEKEEDE
jgi:hypothetical protein